MWEMQFRKIKEKLTFALMLRESIMNTQAKTPSDQAFEAFIGSIAPFIQEEERKKRDEIMKILETETKKPFRVSPVRLPSKKVIPFRKRKK